MAKQAKNIIGHTSTGIPIRVKGVKRLCGPVEDIRNLFGDGNVRWLKEEVKRRGFKNVSRIKRAELKSIIDNNLKPPHTTIQDLRIYELKALARARGINFQPRVKKAELLELLGGNAVEAPEVRLVTTFSNNTTNKFYADVGDYRSSDVDYVLGQAMPIITTRIRDLLGRGKKFRISLEARFVKPDGDEAVSRFWGTRGQMPRVILPDTNLEAEILEQLERMKLGMDEYTYRGSGWVLEMVNRFLIELYEYRPLRGGTYVKTPPNLDAKKAVINVDNSGNKPLDEIRDLAKQLGIDYNTKTTKKRLTELIEAEKPNALKDQKCFKWAVLSCLHPASDHVDRLSNYTPYEKDLDDMGISYPVKITDVQKFADKNKLIINVFEWSNDICGLRECPH